MDLIQLIVDRRDSQEIQVDFTLISEIQID